MLFLLQIVFLNLRRTHHVRALKFVRCFTQLSYAAGKMAKTNQMERAMFLKRTIERIGDVMGLAILLTGLLVGSNLVRGRMRSAPVKRRAAMRGASEGRALNHAV